MAKPTMTIGILTGICFRPDPNGDGQSLQSVNLLAGLGLEGDHHAIKAASPSAQAKPVRQVTLIRLADVRHAAATTGADLGHTDLLRNLVVDCPEQLDSLVGREFRVGDAVLRGTELCPPCKYLEGRTTPGLCDALNTRGGICAEVVRSGTIAIGDSLTSQPVW